MAITDEDVFCDSPMYGPPLHHCVPQMLITSSVDSLAASGAMWPQQFGVGGNMSQIAAGAVATSSTNAAQTMQQSLGAAAMKQTAQESAKVTGVLPCIAKKAVASSSFSSLSSFTACDLDQSVLTFPVGNTVDFMPIFSSSSLSTSPHPHSGLHGSTLSTDDIDGRVGSRYTSHSSSTINASTVIGNISRGDFSLPVPLTSGCHLYSNAAGNMAILPSVNHTMGDDTVPVMQSPSSALATVMSHNNTVKTMRVNQEVQTPVAAASFSSNVYINSRQISEVIQMGFDSETVRKVVHLRVLETGQNYDDIDELVDAVLAYTMLDLADNSNLEAASHQQWPQQLSQLTQRNSRESSPQASRMTTTRDAAQQSIQQSLSSSAAATAEASQEVDSVAVDSSRGQQEVKNLVVLPPPLPPAANSAAPKSRKRNKRKNKRAAGPSAVAAKSLPVEPAKSGSQFKTTNQAGIDELVMLEPWMIEEENKRLKSAKLCKICKEAEVKIVFVPCGHIACCDSCSSVVVKCPVCQKRISEAVKVFFS